MDTERRVVRTSAGIVEVVVSAEAHAPGDTVLYLHGGHESAEAAPACRVYVELGHRVVAVSRPGYGGTDVGTLSPADFAPQIDEVRAALGVDRFRAVVGTSFGGQQAVQYAVQRPARTRSLSLHSAAPSTLPYPDVALQRLLGPVMFHPRIERHVWGATRTVLRRAPEVGLRMMLAPLSTVPLATWFPQVTEADRAEMRDLFATMRSGRGFVVDLAHAGADQGPTRRAAQQRVSCRTLVTGSRHDAGVAWAHSEDLASTIPRASLVDLGAPSHLFWIGESRTRLREVVDDFLGGA